MIDILIVEDNKEIGGLLHDFLENDGFTVKLCSSGEAGLQFFQQEGARLIVLDVMLPGMDGFAVCQEIREKNNTPLLIVSALEEKEDKLNGLMLGADDYIQKPYDIDILLAKIHGIFKRRYQRSSLICGDLELDKVRHIVKKAGNIIKMTVKEFELLQIFMENPGKTWSKESLFSMVWGDDSFSELQTLTVHIKWLREKIEEDAKRPKRLLTVWGIGYRFLEE